MLSIGKLAGRKVEYYVTHVAKGVEDYYLGTGEAPGEWLGAGAARLGLHGQVDADHLRTLLAGTNPLTGDRLLQLPPHVMARRSCPGYDLTFSAPKSVSLLFALGSEDLRRQVVDAHGAAVAAAVEHHLEPFALAARRGAGGAEWVATHGAVAAGFRHRTSRAGDPSLHTHVLVANLVEGVDGRWTSVHGALLYSNAKPTGYVYHAHLRRELTERLGVEWTPVRNGMAEVEGTPRRVIEAFSRRLAEIKAEQAARAEAGLASEGMRASHVAALATRKKKEYAVDGTTLHERWAARGAEIGFARAEVESQLRRTTYRPPSQASREAMLFEPMAGPKGLTERASTFDRADVVMGVAERMPQGASGADIRHWSDEFLASPHSVPLADPILQRVGTNAIRVRPDTAQDARPVVVDRKQQRYSTPEMLAVESRIIDSAMARRDIGTGVVEDEHLRQALDARPSLTAEQREVVRSLTTSGAGVELVSAAAGAGKTFSLGAAREAWEAAGYTVVGAGVAARYAEELQSGAGIQSFTIDRLLLDLADPRHGGFRRSTVLVVDEAAAVGSRRLAALLAHAEAANAKVVLTGDPHQLQPVDAGGAFRGLATRLGAQELTENMRQKEEWERAAVAELRTGDVNVAMTAYREHGRVTVAHSPEAVRQRLVDDYWAAVEAGKQVAMFAPRNSDADDLNRRARARMAEAGRLEGETLIAGGRPFQVGDRVMATRNDRALGVINGNRGYVTAIDFEAGALTFRTDAGKDITLDRDYLADGRLTHAHATSTHKVQGMTVDVALFLGDETVYREMGYTGITRGRELNQWYVVAPDLGPLEEVGLEPPRREDPLTEMTRALHRSAAKELALDHAAEPGTAAMPISALYAERDALRSILNKAPRDPNAELDRLVQLRARVETARRGTEMVAEPGPAGRGRRIRKSPSSRLSDWGERVSELDARIGALNLHAQARSQFFDDHRPELRRYAALDQAIRRREQHHAGRLGAAVPKYVVDAIGPRPAGRSELEQWRHGVEIIARHRLRWGVDDQHSALGLMPANGPARAGHVAARSVLESVVANLRHPAQRVLSKSLDHQDVGPVLGRVVGHAAPTRGLGD